MTSAAIYNVHKKSIKRCIPLKELGGITKTVSPSKNASEFTLHVPREYDYRLVAIKPDKRDEVLNVIKQAFLELMNKNLPIYGVTSKDLKPYTTTESDMKKQTSRMTPPENRLLSEDLMKPEQSKQADTKVTMTTQDTDDYE